ncbi:rCG23228 [Rattus norvegicus]|uniref:RCG23228 n=1 Tax=Rattus norvegicus TaxID=10116 RepID=A6JQ07_RAT|nr:rCG23228 [Rattus norvegicus]
MLPRQLVPFSAGSGSDFCRMARPPSEIGLFRQPLLKMFNCPRTRRKESRP